MASASDLTETALQIAATRFSFCINIAVMRKWRNWQTRRLQVPVVAIPCGFKSRLPHFFYLGRKRLSLIEAGVFFAIKQKVESCKDNPGMIY